MEYKFKKDIFQMGRSIIGVAAIRDDSESLLALLENKNLYLPAIEKMTEFRKQEWLSVRVLLKEMLGEEIEILYLSSGKPYLADHSLHIGISHTKCRGDDKPLGYVALILNKDEEVAIDIEQISPRVEKIQSRFTSEAEEKSLSKANKLKHLLLHWSAKESIFKILNISNVSFKNQLHIAPFEPVCGRWSSFTAHETCTENQNAFTINYYIHEDYVLTFTLSPKRIN
jgi:phosphopantetheinyl transferase